MRSIDWLQVILILLVIGICVLLLVMIAFLMWVLIQRHKSRVLKRKFDDENAREAVRAMYEYTMNILAAAGLNIRNIPCTGMKSRLQRCSTKKPQQSIIVL